MRRRCDAVANPVEQGALCPGNTPSAQGPAAPSSSAPADLAETGSSSSTPLIAGTAAVAVLAGGAILLATGERRTARH
ncbi:LAETG motif-containing sortase-dependent surface protein [Streptomyces sp. 7N604]|uniref:LAETG motif-containing sortase-dependent surface protein n=1 Tax=Streptomyces sp. 7N604 TaxID=3457415 RepID=UPI003FD2351C